MLPNVHNQHFAGCKRKQSALALEILVLSTLSTICALNVHNKNILRHTVPALFAFVLAHPYSLRRLPTLLLGHHAKLCAEEVVKEGRLSGGLRAEDGYEVVVEAGGDDFLEVEICGQVLATSQQLLTTEAGKTERENTLEHLVLIDNLDAMLVGLLGGIFPDGSEVGVHH